MASYTNTSQSQPPDVDSPAPNDDIPRVPFHAFIETVKEASSDIGIAIEATMSYEQFCQILPFLKDDSR